MQLRLVASRIIRCFPRHQPLVTRPGSLERCIFTMSLNLKPSTSSIAIHNLQQYRFKRKGIKSPKKEEEESDSDEDYEDKNDSKGIKDKDFEVEPGSKIITYKLDSLRIDRLLRKALNISGKEVENLFYSKKINLNDKILLKKAHQVDEGDIITVPLEDTPGKTARGALIEVLQIIEYANSCSVTVSRNRNTLVNK